MDSDPSLGEFAWEVSRPDADIDLARAALVIARSEYPALDVDAYLARLAALSEMAMSVRQTRDPLGRLHRLREYLFEEQGFAGNVEDYFDPRNSYLNDVLDRRLGIPITLSLVLIEVGSRLGLQMEGIGLPGHFVTGARVGGEHVLLDPFNGGTILTGEACGDLVARAVGRPVELTKEQFVPVTKRQFLTRVLNNLKGAYWRREAWPKVVAVIDRLLLLTPDAGGEWRDRGVAWTSLGEFAQALADWERYLTCFPNAADHEKVRTQFRRIRQKLAQLN
jgi:regulator of sirC expression with transglutaminase-like and TPR domain